MLAERLNRIPPRLCRILARDGRKPLTLEEIAKRTGINEPRLRRILKGDTWNNIPVEEVDKIMTLCRVDVFHMKRFNEFMRRQAAARTAFSYLKNARNGLSHYEKAMLSLIK